MLTTEQRDSFNRNGYLVCEQVLDAQTVVKPVVSEYASLLATLIQQWVDSGELEAEEIKAIDPHRNFADAIGKVYAAGLDYFQPMDISLPPGKISTDIPFHAGPAIFNLMTNQRLLDIVESLIGSEITSNPIQHVRIKPPATALTSDEIRPHITSTSWHQDRAVTLAEADNTRMITAWVAITDATVENGCLQVIPGSHLANMLEHCPTTQLAIPDNLFDVASAQPLPVKSGGVVLFHPLTVHGSLSNTTSDIRWSFDLRYNVTGDPTGRPMFPEFIARSKTVPESMLTDSAEWRNRWMEARTQLSGCEPVEIHRWDGQSEVCA